MSPSITSRTFGVLPGGKDVQAWTLSDPGCLLVEIITWGATVTRLLVPDREGQLADVVLSFGTLEDYLSNHPYFGATVGRVAGRIPHASFVLDGKRYKLTVNNGTNHLHGGLCGFDRKLWIAEPLMNRHGAASLRLTSTSPDGEEGYPGNIRVSVIYTVASDGTLVIESEAISDANTALSMTHHSYFNLGGEAHGTIADHTLEIFSDGVNEVDDAMTLLGRINPVDKANDFRNPRLLADAIPMLFMQHGDLYRLRSASTDSQLLAARLSHAKSGRVMEVWTNESHLQLYTGVSLDGAFTGKSGLRYRQHAGVCLECQGYPDGVNHPELGDIVLRKGEVQRRSTTFRFQGYEDI